MGWWIAQCAVGVLLCLLWGLGLSRYQFKSRELWAFLGFGLVFVPYMRVGLLGDVSTLTVVMGISAVAVSGGFNWVFLPVRHLWDRLVTLRDRERDYPTEQAREAWRRAQVLADLDSYEVNPAELLSQYEAQQSRTFVWQGMMARVFFGLNPSEVRRLLKQDVLEYKKRRELVRELRKESGDGC